MNTMRQEKLRFPSGHEDIHNQKDESSNTRAKRKKYICDSMDEEASPRNSKKKDTMRADFEFSSLKKINRDSWPEERKSHQTVFLKQVPSESSMAPIKTAQQNKKFNT